MTAHCLKRNTVNQEVVAHDLIPAPRKQKQVDFCEFETSLIYKISSKEKKKERKKEKKNTVKDSKGLQEIGY